MSDIKLTLYPGEIVIGNTLRFENGSVYEVLSVDDSNRYEREYRIVKAKRIDDGEEEIIADATLVFKSEVRSYGEYFSVEEINLIDSHNTAKVKLKRLSLTNDIGG